MQDHAVVVAGAGPTGLMLAAELRLAGVDVVVIERRETADLPGSRAGGLHARSLEVMEMRGLAERFLSAGKAMQVGGFAGVPIDISDFPSRHPYGLALWQREIERLLLARAEELGVVIRRGLSVAGLEQEEDGVRVALSDGSGLRAGWLVGCDGGRSVVRKAVGIGFPGWDATVSHILAEVRMAEAPELGMRQSAQGMNGLSLLEDGETVRVLLTEAAPGASGEPGLDEVRAGLIAVWDRDFGVHSPVWITRFTDMARQADRYRAGRVLIAGDAAHVHYPAGGQGLNTGVQDAVNLGWKLAQVVQGVSPDSLLDSYHAERHPVAARVVQMTLAQVALMRPDPRSMAAKEVMAGLLAMDGPRQSIGGTMSGLDIRYDLGGGHPIVGRRMPDLDLVAEGQGVRMSALLHGAQPVLVDFGAGVAGVAAPWGARVVTIRAEPAGPWDLPVIGNVAAAGAVLVRPDGHVAWAGDTAAGLEEALTRWVGAPLPSAAG